MKIVKVVIINFFVVQMFFFSFSGYSKTPTTLPNSLRTPVTLPVQTSLRCMIRNGTKTIVYSHYEGIVNVYWYYNQAEKQMKRVFLPRNELNIPVKKGDIIFQSQKLGRTVWLATYQILKDSPVMSSLSLSLGSKGILSSRHLFYSPSNKKQKTKNKTKKQEGADKNIESDIYVTTSSGIGEATLIQIKASIEELKLERMMLQHCKVVK